MSAKCAFCRKMSAPDALCYAAWLLLLACDDSASPLLYAWHHADEAFAWLLFLLICCPPAHHDVLICLANSEQQACARIREASLHFEGRVEEKPTKASTWQVSAPARTWLKPASALPIYENASRKSWRALRRRLSAEKRYRQGLSARPSDGVK